MSNHPALTCGTTNEATATTRICPRCNGTRKVYFSAIGDIPASEYPCHNCEEKGHFLPVDVSSILSEIQGRKGLRSSRPESRRAYYVWRLARFHGGADVTMPVTAMSFCGKDPFIKELDHMADCVARAAFGTDRAAAARWGGLLGLTQKSPPSGLPETAYECGPVCTVEKPEEEFLELHG
jgi:hypothetical protein